MHSETRWRPDARTTLDTCALGGRTTVPAHQRLDSRRGHYRTTLTTVPAGLPTPLHGPHCRTPVPGPSPVTAGSHRCDTHTPTALRCALRRPFPANPFLSRPANLDIDDSPWSASPTSFFVNMSRVYSINAVNRLTGLFPHG